MGDARKLIPLFGVVNLPEMEALAIEVLRSGRIAGGEYVSKFEDELGCLLNQKNVISTVDMTSAVFLALQLIGVKPGDEILTTAFACMATNAAIAQCGAIPVWVDVRVNSVEMDVEDVFRKITEKTKAVILYHVAGYPGPAEELSALCRKHLIPLIEDCDNALFAYRHGWMVGSHGDFAIYSFYPNRQINCAEGGALICKSEDMANEARKLRRFGIDPASFRNRIGEISPSADIPRIGWSLTMNNLNAALGYAQLKTVRDRTLKAQANAAILRRYIGDLDGLQIIHVDHGVMAAYWVFLILIDNREIVLERLKIRGINASSLHFRNDKYSGFRKSPFPDLLKNTEYLQEHILALPCGWWLNEADLVIIRDELVNTIIEFQ